MTAPLISTCKMLAYKTLDILMAGRGIPRKIGGENIRFPAQWSRYYESNYEPITFNFLRENLAKGDTYLDCGGHIGLFAVVGAKLVGESGRVFTFEPTLLSRSVLIKTVKLNNCQNIVDVRPEAVSRTTGTAIFFDTGSDVSNANSLIKTGNHKGGLEVETISLDDFAEIQQLSRINCIKIDVEGSELNTLLGAEKIIRKYRPTISLGLHPFAYDIEIDKLTDIWELLRSYNLSVKFKNKSTDKDWFINQTEIFDVQCFPDKS